VTNLFDMTLAIRIEYSGDFKGSEGILTLIGICRLPTAHGYFCRLLKYPRSSRLGLQVDSRILIQQLAQIGDVLKRAFWRPRGDCPCGLGARRGNTEARIRNLGKMMSSGDHFVP
jgi:hypothetical protein